MILSDGEEDGDGGLIYGYWRRVGSVVVVMVEMLDERSGKRRRSEDVAACQQYSVSSPQEDSVSYSTYH